ncbi:MAG: hypothetical protein ACW98X_27025 [Promethearchaeota archaeon]|jgi:hypothetical protein
MKEAMIQTSVNVALNQNDMVELMLEEQKEVVEKQIENQGIVIDEKKVQAAEAWAKVEEAVLAVYDIRKTKGYAQFSKVLKSLKLKEEADISVKYNDHTNGDESYVHIDWSALEAYSKPMPYYRKLLSEIKADSKQTGDRYALIKSNYRYIGQRNHNKVRTISFITGHVNAVTGDDDFRISFDHRIDFDKPNAKIKKLINTYEKAEKAHFQSLQDLQAYEGTLFTLEYDNVRNKAKFVKGLLANSDTGKELVQLMGTVKNSNLVQIGEGK